MLKKSIYFRFLHFIIISPITELLLSVNLLRLLLNLFFVMPYHFQIALTYANIFDDSFISIS